MKRFLCLICCVMGLLTFSGCKINSFKKMSQVNYSVILTQKQSEYYVFVYSTTCSVCESIESQVTTYAHYAKTNSDALPIYIINLNSKANDGILLNDPKDYVSFMNTKNYRDIRFSTAPAMIRVKGGAVVEIISSNTTEKPKTEILNTLNKAMGISQE